MNKIKLLGFLLLIAALPALAQSGYELNFKVVGLSDKTIYLGYHFGDQRYVKDTTEVGFGGKVTFKGEKELPKGIYFLYSPNYYFEFIVSEQNFSLSTSIADGYKDLEVENSRENQIFKEFQLGMIALQNERKQTAEPLAAATSKADSAVVYEKMAAIDKAASVYRKNMATKYEGSFVSEIIWLMERPTIPEFNDLTDQERAKERYEYYKAHYFDKIDIKNTSLLKTPVFAKTVLEYLDEVVLQQPDTLISKIDWILNAVEKDEESYRFWLVTFFTKYQKSELMGMDAIMVHLAEKYYLAGRVSWVDQEAIDKLKDEISFIKPNLIGKAAPTLQLLDINLKPMNLRELASEYTILYFYDPDCGHCKKKTPVLLEAYQKLKSQNVEVLAVCTVTDMEKWKNYVAEQKLDWKNAADPFYKSNFRQEYNVRSTPVIYVLDKDKKIIAKKLDVDQLEEFIMNHRRIGSL